MAVIDQQTQRQICDLVNACQGYWELRGISPERTREMREELKQHLEQALHDGKSLEAVVGANALDFAESWARETPHQVARGFPVVLRWIILNWLPFALVLLTLIALSEHLLRLSPSFTFTFEDGFVSIALIGLYTALQGLIGFFTPRIKSRENRILIAFGIYAVIGVLVTVILRLLKVPLEATLFRWEWPVTLLISVVAAVLLGAKCWLERKSRQPATKIW